MQPQVRPQLELYSLALPLTVCLLIHRHALDCMHAGQRQQLQRMVGRVCANAISNTSQHQMHRDMMYREGFGRAKGV